MEILAKASWSTQTFMGIGRMNPRYLVSALVSRQVGPNITYGHRAGAFYANSPDEAQGIGLRIWLVDGYALESIDCVVLSDPAEESLKFKVQQVAETIRENANEASSDHFTERGVSVLKAYAMTLDIITGGYANDQGSS